MKRIGVLLLSIMLGITAYSQNNHSWQSIDFENAQMKYNDVKKRFKGSGNKVWARKILEAFPIAPDKTIKHQYVIQCDTAYNVEVISDVLSAWCRTKFPQSTLDNINSREHLRISGVLKGVGEVSGAFGAYINATEEVSIDIKENRVRVTSRIIN